MNQFRRVLSKVSWHRYTDLVPVHSLWYLW